MFRESSMSDLGFTIQEKCDGSNVWVIDEVFQLLVYRVIMLCNINILPVVIKLLKCKGNFGY